MMSAGVMKLSAGNFGIRNFVLGPAEALRVTSKARVNNSSAAHKPSLSRTIFTSHNMLRVAVRFCWRNDDMGGI